MGDNRGNGANLGAWYVQANNGWSYANGNNWSARQPLENACLSSADREAAERMRETSAASSLGRTPRVHRERKW